MSSHLLWVERQPLACLLHVPPGKAIFLVVLISPPDSRVPLSPLESWATCDLLLLLGQVLVHLFVYKKEGRLECVTFTPTGLWNLGQEARECCHEETVAGKRAASAPAITCFGRNFSSLDFLHQQTLEAGFHLQFWAHAVY